ncbi:MAG TPA: NAD-dependent epimerase/dehydratase family protein [Vicinamibacterales bacterium]|nr:NAD-dependent epimerase/dehydratase family protein [Vicinamibacterales bacterium]
MSGRAIFVTGASGFVGRRLVPVLAGLGRPVIALDRTGALASSELAPGVSVCRGDLLTPDSYLSALRGCDIVVHLAAATGKATAADHRRVNAEGTAALVEACQQAGVERLLFVSSIAVTFTDQTGYHYAAAKTAAELAVTRSGLRTAIVRPTMIFGAGSPVEAALAKLALLPVVVVPGSGRVRVQPVHVDDLVACLAEIVERNRFLGDVLEVGGPDVLAIADLLQAIRASRGGQPGRVLRLPLPLLRWPALVAERAGLGAVLPVTAGQLASFANDSTAAPALLDAAQPARMIPLTRMLGTVPAAPSSSDTADRECRVFTRHLLGVEADASVLDTYRDAIARVPALASKSAFDDVLLATARRGAAWTHIADAYSALLARDSALRRRLVMVLAILETRAPFHHRIDAPDGVPGLKLWTRVGLRVVLAAVSLAAGVLVFAPVRVAVAVLGRGR